MLGHVRSVGTKEPLSPTELHLAKYTAFHRRGENADTIATMVWPKGDAERTVTNAMVSLRPQLGTGSDGTPLFPLGRDNQYVYRLSTRVGTDWDRFERLVTEAGARDDETALAPLDKALSLVAGIRAEQRVATPGRVPIERLRALRRQRPEVKNCTGK